VATLFTGLGLRSKDHRTKYKYYRVAVYIMVLSRMFMLVNACKKYFHLIGPVVKKHYSHCDVEVWPDLHGELVGLSHCCVQEAPSLNLTRTPIVLTEIFSGFHQSHQPNCGIAP
jgi:hypothetical protein